MIPRGSLCLQGKAGEAKKKWTGDEKVKHGTFLYEILKKNPGKMLNLQINILNIFQKDFWENNVVPFSHFMM